MRVRTIIQAVLPHITWFATFGAIVLVLVLAASGGKFQMQQWAQWLVLCILALSFVWVWGHGGIFSFAQVAFFGLGAYTYAIVSINISASTGETLTAVIAGIIVASLIAAFIGYFLFYGHVSDIYVSIATLAVSLVLFTLSSSTADSTYRIGDALLGGFNGMVGIPSLTIGFPGMSSAIVVGKSFFITVGIIAVLIALLIVLIRTSNFGRAVAAIRENEKRANLLGLDVPKYKLFTFTISGAIAGLAGTLYAAWGNFVDPTAFGLQMATLLAVWVLVGGRSSVIGAFVGVFLVQQLTSSIASTGSTITPLLLGIVLIVVVLLIPRGILPSLGSMISGVLRSGASGRRAQVTAADADDEEQIVRVAELPASISLSEGIAIRSTEVRKVFGGIAAVDGVTIGFENKGVYCLVGPNGAGKSTLFHLLVGTHSPSGGSISFDGTTVSRRSVDWRVRQGLSIKSQVPSLFPKLTVRENLWVAAYATSRNKQIANNISGDLLVWLGYADTAANENADQIAHGKQQWLDIAMALSQRPKALLLDEPTAGMGRVETSKVAATIRKIADRIPVIVVEHDMDFVRELESPVSVLHQGKLLMTGTLDEIRANDQVLSVYLGRN